MNPITVGISGLNAVDNPGPGVGVARSLLADEGLEVRIVGLAYNALEPGIYLDDIIERSFTLPYPSGTAAEYLARLAYIQETAGLDCIIPCLDAELPLFIRYADQLAAMGLKTFLPTMSQFRLRGKDKLQELADHAGLRAPKTAVITHEEELYQAVTAIGFPCFVKGIYYEARRVFTMAEAVGQYRRLLAEWGGPVLVQEIIGGEELNLIGLGDGEGGILGMVGARKTVVTAQGKMWSGVSVRHPGMMDAAERLVGELQWRGPFELECIVRGDDVFIIEINPRFPAWVYFATAVGVNLPARLLRRLFDLPAADHSDYQVGQIFLRYSFDMVASADRFQQALTTGQTS